MKRWIHYLVGGLMVVGLGLSLTLVLPGCGRQKARDAAKKTAAGSLPFRPGDVEVVEEDILVTSDGKLVTCDGKGTAKIGKDVKGQARADVLMDQWRRDHADSRWVEEEKAAHAFKPPADNSDVLKGGQGKGHAYGDFTETDLKIWTRETEKMVAEGSRIFHSGDLLGSTAGVSCDMCHPHASNTHPETYPKFQTQLGRVVLLRDMINWCIENPVRGKKLDTDSAEMRALEAYIMAQRKGVEMNYGKQ
jgi:thiosulfate dehydrogenase